MQSPQGWKVEVNGLLMPKQVLFINFFMVKGEDVYGKLKFESGSHRGQRPLQKPERKDVSTLQQQLF